MAKATISRDDILKTLEEHDALRRDAFLDLYGYREASTYLLVHDGMDYDSKAIAGVAHKYQHGAPLTPKQLSGGLGHAVDWLKQEGFKVVASRNPKWTRDELILACDLVVRNKTVSYVVRRRSRL
ncbi:hypothetical protein OHB39_24260 [Streptomyces sp. NBC_00047]|uniref:hypothetical protein n=1 Tax=Streptomyces sp. NBC_00047 TaxID=2975627 RepID=UPI002255AE75|nr:hypothetical protein [Streptomyces sp. NBC_00047]MCX5610656.1 hypothetical protein [Streptomyces sp. NBC_00047]